MESNKIFRPDPGLKLMDQVRQVLRYHHYAYRTEQTYCDWIVSYIRFHGGKTHPRDMGKIQIDAYLSHLATNRKVSASTQRQALNAIIFLYRYVLDQPIEGQIEPTRAKRRWHHVLESGLQKAVKVAADRAGIMKRIGCHTFRHSFATHMLEDGINIRVVQELMGHADVKTTEIYTHVMEKDISATLSPLDTM